MEYPVDQHGYRDVRFWKKKNERAVEIFYGKNILYEF